MLPLEHRIAFAVFALITLVLGARGFYRVYRRIVRGAADADGRVDQPVQRAWHALWTTLLQTRVFRKRRVLSVFHSFIFYAFVLYLAVNAVDALDGYVNVRPIGSPALRVLYGGLSDLFSVLAIVGVLAFVLRRFALPARNDFRFNARTLLHEDVKRGYIQRDSVIVSVFILFHVGSRIVGNSARLATEGVDRAQPFGSWLAPVFAGPHAMAWRIFGYWGALGSILLFLVYFPYSKHMHLMMAPVKYFFRRDAGSGALPKENIDLEAAELKVGASQLADLSWPRLLDAYACIQCNRCQDVCPASQTGKALSPSALEINKRMVLNEIAGQVSAFSLAGSPAFETGQASGPNLLRTVISAEAVWGCTTCGACMQVCPTQDEQMLDIIDVRRNLVMAEGEFPAQLQTAFRGMERASNPWGIAREKRMAWAEGLDVPTVEQVPDPDVLYWVGCAASYDASAQKTARATVQLLQEAKVRFAVLGKRECCTGDSARRAGNELLYQQMATEAVAVLNEVRPKTVLASCPHCVNTIAAEYPQFGGNFHVMHHTEYLAQLVDEGRLQPVAGEGSVTFHDPCYLGRHRGTYEQPRSVLKVLANEYVELPRSKSGAFCCGAGGAQFWKEEEPGTERVAENRFREAEQTLAKTNGAKTLAVGCPFCKSMLGSTTSAGDSEIAIRDVAELLWEGVQRRKGVWGARALPVAAVGAVLREAVGTGTVVVEDAAGVAVVPAASAVAASSAVSVPVVASASASAVTAVPVVEASGSSTLQGAVREAAGPGAENVAGRKKWAPKKSAVESAPVEAAVPTEAQRVETQAVEGAAAVSVAGGSAERKKWTPKAKPVAVPTEDALATVQGEANALHGPEVGAVTEVQEQAAAAPVSEGAPQRRKWVPKTAASSSAQVRVEAQPAPGPVQEADDTAAAEGLPESAVVRKKWQPKKPNG